MSINGSGGIPRVWLVHWNAAESAECAARLRAVGFDAHCGPVSGPGLLRMIRQSQPAAVVIDLTRLPSHGRDVALVLRQQKATRGLPLLFAGGDPEKVKRIRALLPDAVYAGWPGIAGALARAIARPPAAPVVPESALAGYSGTPLPRKLGIKADSLVALEGAPQGFLDTLGELPDGTVVRRRNPGRRDLTLWFVRRRAELEGRIQEMATAVGLTPLWIAWPKQASGEKTDVTQPVVREAGLAAGLVDYKICAIDATWSGLLFRTRRRR